MADFTAWLGPAAADLTEEQRDAFDTRATAYYALPFHTLRDPADQVADAAEDAFALSAILQDILQEDSLRQAGDRARRAEDRLTGWIRAAAAAGVPERTIEQQSGLARKTIRKHLGK